MVLCNLRCVHVVALLGLLGRALGWGTREKWYTALKSNVDNDDFLYHSDIWESGTSFGNEVSRGDGMLTSAFPLLPCTM